MSKLRIVRAAIAVVLPVFVLSLAGCENPFAPKGGGGGGDVDVQYKLRTSRQNVIDNLETAYVYMNIDEYLDCLAEEFEFHLAEVDLENDSSLPPYWGKTTERQIHRKMFGLEAVPPENQVDDITLTLTPGPSDYDAGEDPTDPMDDRWTYLVETDLKVWFPNDLQRLATAPVEFVFRIDPLETGPDGEVLYEIIRWEDLAQGDEERGSQTEDPNVETLSFGRLKAGFLE